MNISAPFILRPVMTTFVMLAIVVAGWMAFCNLPVNDLPNIEYPSITVSTEYAGASPETVLNQITIPIENELASVKGVEGISSTSSEGNSSISMSFSLNKNMDEAIRDIQAAINRAETQLPKSLETRPAYFRQDKNQEPIIYIFLSSDQLSVGELRNYAEAYITPRLSRIEGVSKLDIFGAEKSIWLKVNPDLMAARHIGFNEVIDAIKRHTSQVPLGSIQTSNKTLAIELSGSLRQAKDLENLPIGNQSVRLKEIATISEDDESDAEFHFVTKDKSSTALVLLIKKVNDANTVAVSKAVRKTLSEIEKELPSSINLKLWFDKAVWIKASITDVQWSLLFAFVLVILVIYFSLGRIIDALIPSAALPLSLVGTFIIMYLLGFSLNLLSLLALTLSVGFVVDDAIVVLENIVRHQEDKGLSPLKASLQGSKQICFTIISMTLSLVAVFIPLLFMKGINGRLFREFSITLAVAILVSGFISLSLIPMLSSFLTTNRKENKLQKRIAGMNKKMVGLYGKTLKYCFIYPKTILLLAILCMLVTIPLFTKLPITLIPPEDRGFLFTSVNLPSGISEKEVTTFQNKLESIFQKKPYINVFLSINFDDNLLFLIQLQPHSARSPQPVVIEDLQKSLDCIPGIQSFTQGYQMINLNMEFGNAGQYKMRISGLEFQDVENAAFLLSKELRSHPEISFVQSSIQNDSPKLVVHVDEEQANKLGFHKQHIQELLQQAYGYGSVGTIQKGTNREKIKMEMLPEYNNHPGSLSNLSLISDAGDLVPLKAIAEWEEQLGSIDLQRQNQLPTATIYFSFTDHVAPNIGLKKVQQIAAQVLPSSVNGVLDGSAKSIASTVKNVLLLLLAAALVMYIVLGILYESFIHPLTILSSLPFAALGGILTLFLFNEPISIFSAVGFLLLIGIVKKNGIMMVDYALEAQKQGMSPEEAIFEGCQVRIRPIMMTTVAAVMGAIPIAIGIGEGAETHRGLGLVIVGGLLFAQVLTLYVTPILYLTFSRLFKSHQLPFREALS